MAIWKWNLFGLVSVVYFALVRAGNDGGWESHSSCVPVTTTVYSVSTSYYEKIVEKTVWSTNIVYLTDTTTQIQVQPTTITDTTTQIQVRPTTITDITTQTQVLPTTIVNPTTIPTTIVNQQTITHTDVNTITDTVTTTVISNIVGPTTTVSTCPTTPLTGLVTCTSRIVNPTYTPPGPLPSNYLWGCPPGTICTPPQVGCNFEQNPPADSYVCAPKECKPLPEITVPEDFAPSPEPNPTDADCAWYKPNPGFFNLNPEFFGLTFDIFDIYGQPVCPPPSPTTTKSGWADWGTPAPSHSYTPRMVRRNPRSWNPLAQITKRQLGIAPAQCYRDFNAANYIGQNVGLVYDLLCPLDTDFMIAVERCKTCSATFSAVATTTEDFPELQRYYVFCLANGTSTG